MVVTTLLLSWLCFDPAHIFNDPQDIIVKMGYFYLDLHIKIGYHKLMFRSILSFVLRISLIATIWVFVWKFMEPRTQLMRILRAALLVLGLLAALAVMRIMGQ